jgi:hypothetical protein
MPEATLSPPGAWSRLRRNRAAMGALGLLLLMVIFAVVGPWCIDYRPAETSKNQFQLPRQRRISSAPISTAATCSRG